MGNSTGSLQKLSLQEKLAIVKDQTFWQNTTLNSSKIKKIVELEDLSSFTNDITTINTIMNSWDLNLLKDYATIKANQLKQQKKNVVVVPLDLLYFNNVEKDTPYYNKDVFLTEKVLKTYVDVLKSENIITIGHCSISFNKETNDQSLFLLSRLELDSVIIENDYELAKKLRNEYNYLNTIFVKTTDETKNLYNFYFNQYLNEELDESYVDELLIEITDFTEKLYSEPIISEELIGFDEFYEELIYKSAILYKNNQQILKNLNREDFVVIGSYKHDISLNELKKDIKNTYKNCEGIYSNYEEYFKVIDKLEDVKNIIYFYNEDSLEDINKLVESEKDVILVLPNNITSINQELENLVNVILISDITNNQAILTNLEILIRNIETKGRLYNDILVKDNKKYSNEKIKGIKYLKLEVNNTIVSVSIRNTSNEDKEVLTKLYVYSKENPLNKVLLDFNKTLFKANEYKVLEIDISAEIVKHISKQNENIVFEIINDNEIQVSSEDINKEENLVKQELKKSNGSFKLILLIIILLFNVPIVMLILNGEYRYSPIAYVALLLFIDYVIFKFARRGKTVKRMVVNNKSYDAFDEVPYLKATHEVSFKNQEVEELSYVRSEDNIYKNIIKPKQIVSNGHHFSEEVDIETYLDNLKDYMNENGLKVDTETIRDFFASFAGSKLIITRNEQKEIPTYFMDVFANYIGGSVFHDNFENVYGSFDQNISDDNNEIGLGIEQAINNEDKIHIMVLRNVKLSNANHTLRELIDFAANPKDKHYLYLSNGSTEIPNNVWFVVIPLENNSTSEELNFASFDIDLNGEIVKPLDIVQENSLKLSNYYFRDIIEEARSQYHLTEDNWKKFDQLENYFISHGHKVLENRVIRSIEQYSAIYLLAQGEEDNAIDNIFKNKVVPLIKDIDFKPKSEEDEGLLTMFDKLFGLENLNKSQRLITSIEDKTKGDI